MVNLFPGVPAHCLCDKHLNSVLSEYTNLLMPAIRKGKSIRGYIRHGCVDLPKVYRRVLDCLLEAKRRGKNWKYSIGLSDSEMHVKLMEKHRAEFPDIDDPQRRKEMVEMNLRILMFRCPECRERIVAAGYMRELAAAEMEEGEKR